MGISDVRLHDLRHSFASDALMGGVPLAIVGEMLGHLGCDCTEACVFDPRCSDGLLQPDDEECEASAPPSVASWAAAAAAGHALDNAGSFKTWLSDGVATPAEAPQERRRGAPAAGEGAA